MAKIQKQHKGLAACKVALKKARAGGAELTQEKAAEVAMATISAFEKKDGTPISLTDRQKDIVNAMFYPTIGVRVRVLQHTLDEAKSELDATMAGLLKPLLTPTALEKKLKAIENPETINWSEMVADDEGSGAQENPESDPQKEAEEETGE
jgi:hypothetical protein